MRNSLPLVYGGPNVEVGVDLSQLRRTCDECHLAKVRCSGTLNEACPRCLKMGKECQYSMSGRAKRRRSSALSSSDALSNSTSPVRSPQSPPNGYTSARFTQPAMSLPGHLTTDSFLKPMQGGWVPFVFAGRGAASTSTGTSVLQPSHATAFSAWPAENRGPAARPPPRACQCFFDCVTALADLEAVSTTQPLGFDAIIAMNQPAIKASSALLFCDSCLQLSGGPAVAAILGSILAWIGSLYVDAGVDNVTAAVAAADPALTAEAPHWSAQIQPPGPIDAQTVTLSRHLIYFSRQVQAFEAKFGYLAREELGISRASLKTLKEQVANIRSLRDWGMPAGDHWRG